MTSAYHSFITSTAVRAMRRKLKNCDLPYTRWWWWTGTSAIRKPASVIFFISSRQITPLSFSSAIVSKIFRRMRRKSQSTSRTLRPKSSFTVW